MRWAPALVLLLTLAAGGNAHAQSGVLVVPEGYAPSPEPPVAATPAPYTPPGARVRFTSTDARPPTVFVRDDGGWRRLCTTPCEQRLGFGGYAFGLSLGEQDPVAIRGGEVPVGLGAIELSAHYDDGSHDHEVGTGLLVGSLLVASGVGGGLLGATFAFFGSGTIGGALAGVVTLIFSVVGFAAGIAMLIAGVVLLERDPRALLTEVPSGAIWPG